MYVCMYVLRIKTNDKINLHLKQMKPQGCGVGWLFVCFGLFYGVSTLFVSFNTKLSHFDKCSNNSV